MKKVKISFGSVLVWLHSIIIEVEDWETEQDALNKLIDELEEEGCEGYFINNEDLNNYDEDMYIVGGNHCLNFLHYGTLIFEEVE